ncbi:DUF4174 domain-containing protein [Roseivivax sp. CAU 1761]
MTNVTPLRRLRVQALDPDRADLSDLRIRARPLLLFADAPEDRAFLRQCDLLEAAAPDLARRDVALFCDTDPAAGGGLRARYAPRGFLLILCDRSGGLIRRAVRPVAPERLLDTIDRMPVAPPRQFAAE